MNTLPRRSAIAASLTYWVGTQQGAWAAGEADAGEHDSVDVTAPEDLMREHGVLNRLMLVYEAALLTPPE